MPIRRRELLKIVAALPLLQACAGRSTALFFTDAEKVACARLADLVLPTGDGTPGGAALGAVGYIDALLSGEGLIFGSGPFSGRTPLPDERGLPTHEFPPDDFSVAEPLDRVQRAAVQALLFGASDPVRGDDPGLRRRFRTALASVTEHTTLDDLDVDFRDDLIALVSEGCFGAPEYGGNVDLKGWQLVHYEGDQMPLGFTTFDTVTNTYRERLGQSVSQADEIADPDPIDTDVEALLGTAIVFLGGKDTKGGA
ncbi:MAG TPA: hypothetical protein VGO62_12065 [Myxococcota bacterium]